MRVLLVEDSQKLSKYLSRSLRQAGYALDAAGDGEQGLWLAESNDYDVIVLDLMLPKLDGYSILKKLRQIGCQSHVLILSARDQVEDRVRGLQEGADDYLVKPFSVSELQARIQTLVRRRYAAKSPLLKIGDLQIDTARRQVTRRSREVALPPREYALLELLAYRQGEVVSRSEIERHIYDERVEPFSNVVDSAICSLRKRIDLPDEPSCIQTRRGMGYVLRGNGA